MRERYGAGVFHLGIEESFWALPSFAVIYSFRCVPRVLRMCRNSPWANGRNWNFQIESSIFWQSNKSQDKGEIPARQFFSLWRYCFWRAATLFSVTERSGELFSSSKNPRKVCGKTRGVWEIGRFVGATFFVNCLICENLALRFTWRNIYFLGSSCAVSSSNLWRCKMQRVPPTTKTEIKLLQDFPEALSPARPEGRIRNRGHGFDKTHARNFPSHASHVRKTQNKFGGRKGRVKKKQLASRIARISRWISRLVFYGMGFSSSFLLLPPKRHHRGLYCTVKGREGIAWVGNYVLCFCLPDSRVSLHDACFRTSHGKEKGEISNKTLWYILHARRGKLHACFKFSTWKKIFAPSGTDQKFPAKPHNFFKDNNPSSLFQFSTPTLISPAKESRKKIENFSLFLLNSFFFFFFFASRGALRNHSPSAPTSPSSGKPLPFFDFRRGKGMDGLQTGRKLVGRHRDLNPGPPAWESGVLAITLRGPPQAVKLTINFG